MVAEINRLLEPGERALFFAEERVHAADPVSHVAVHDVPMPRGEYSRIDSVPLAARGETYAAKTGIDSSSLDGSASIAWRITRSASYAHALLGLLLSMETANFPDPGAQNLRHAERSANEALRLDSRLVDGWIALGTACAEGGRNEEAVRALRTALDLASNAELALDMLGYAYR